VREVVHTALRVAWAQHRLRRFLRCRDSFHVLAYRAFRLSILKSGCYECVVIWALRKPWLVL
jgi:hypothetical protein